jgi:hypothetical protein
MLFMFDHSWDFDSLVEDEAEIVRSCPFCGIFGDFRVYVTGMGCWPMGLPMFRPFCNV